METVGQLEETARKLEDVTTKIENLAEKMEGIENEAKKEESLFNKILAKKTFGILGWGFFAFVIVSLIAQEIGVTLVRMLRWADTFDYDLHRIIFPSVPYCLPCAFTYYQETA